MPLRASQARLAIGALLALLSCAAAFAVPAGPAAIVEPPRSADVIDLPNLPDSLKFAVIGDNGTGEQREYETARQLWNSHEKFDFPFVVMVGDNIYGSDRPQDFVRKFEAPYKQLLDAGVKFYASLGNHDSREQSHYKLFNMGGKYYYSFKAPKENVRFFALESSYMDSTQLTWVQNELESSKEDWKIVYFHHPLYSSGRTHGSTLKLREVLEPMLIKYSVSLVFSGHDHVYERIKPQNGIAYFVEGSSGQLRNGDLNRGSPLTARGFDSDQTFMLCELKGDQLNFQAISRDGNVVDSGIVMRRKPQK
jgi:calcineurin-like phosphoesterase family protein